MFRRVMFLDVCIFSDLRLFTGCIVRICELIWSVGGFFLFSCSGFLLFRGFSGYVVIFCVDLGPGTSVMGNVGVFLGFLGMQSLTATFWGHWFRFSGGSTGVGVPGKCVSFYFIRRIWCIPLTQKFLWSGILFMLFGFLFRGSLAMWVLDLGKVNLCSQFGCFLLLICVC